MCVTSKVRVVKSSMPGPSPAPWAPSAGSSLWLVSQQLQSPLLSGGQHGMLAAPTGAQQQHTLQWGLSENQEVKGQMLQKTRLVGTLALIEEPAQGI